MIPSFRQVFTTVREVDSWLKDRTIPNKVLLFHEKDETPILYKGMSSIYRDRLDFGEVTHNRKEII